MSLSCKLEEAHYCSLNSQSNVYGLTKIATPDGRHKMLVASLRGKVVSLEFDEKTRPTSREVHFTYIPGDLVMVGLLVIKVKGKPTSGDAEIVSIDAFNKHHYVVGITFIKLPQPAEGKLCKFLNIYAAWEPGFEYDLDIIAQGCQNLELNFVPYQLYHTELAIDGNTEMVFLLSGSDRKVHLYREDRQMHTFNEESVEADEFFPEFANLQSNVAWMHIQLCNDSERRITALGCLNGYVQVTVVHTNTKEITSSWCIQHDSPITSVLLFTLNTQVECPSFVSHVIDTGDDGFEMDVPDFHLAVVSALEPLVVYRSILEKGFGDGLLLPDSDKFDCGMCVHASDVDFDGENELLLGTYGQELIVYKFNPRELSVKSEGSEINATENSQSSSRHSNSGLTDGDFNVLWQRNFADPLLAVDGVDVTGDGLREIIVLSLKGLHVLQHDLKDVAQQCQDRMKQLILQEQQSQQEDIFKQLLSENLS